MRRSWDKPLLIILALLLAVAPFQTAISAFEDLPDHPSAPSMLAEMQNPDHASHGCNTNDCCNTTDCSTASCSSCSTAPGLIQSYSFAIDGMTTTHHRHTDPSIPSWNTPPPIRPPWS